MKPEAWAGLYRLLAGVGMPRPEVPCEVAGGQVSLGWPELELALATDTDDPGPARKAGWMVYVLPNQSLVAAAPLLETLDSLAFERRLRASRAEAKATTSNSEQLLLAELYRLGLPEPDRNYEFRRDNGQMVTVPDFAWPERRLAVFLDGHRFHSSAEVDDLLHTAATDSDRGKQFRASVKIKADRDAANRRHLSALGWMCATVTDDEVSTPTGAAQAAADIAQTYGQLGSKTPPSDVQPPDWALAGPDSSF